MNALPLILGAGAALVLLGGKKKDSTTSETPASSGGTPGFVPLGGAAFDCRGVEASELEPVLRRLPTIRTVQDAQNLAAELEAQGKTRLASCVKSWSQAKFSSRGR